VKALLAQTLGDGSHRVRNAPTELCRKIGHAGLIAARLGTRELSAPRD
jgi:hypothetical protein